MQSTIAAAALAGLAIPAFAGLNVFDLAPTYTGTWVDPNFTDGGGNLVGGSLDFGVSIDDPTPAAGDETAFLSMTLGGSPGGGPLPPFALALPVNAAGLIDVMNVPMPDLDGDIIFNTGGDFYATPTVDVTWAGDGTLEIHAYDAAGFGYIMAQGQLDSNVLVLDVDIFDPLGHPISLGSTLEAFAVPGPSSWLSLLLAGGIFRRWRRV